MAERGENALIILVGQPTIVTNSTIAGIVDEAAESGEFAGVFGALEGIAGVLENKIIDFDAQKHRTIEGLKITPGSVLSGRHRPLSDDDLAQFFEVLQSNEIGTVFVLGGAAVPEVLQRLQSAAVAVDYPLSVLGAPVSIQNDVNIGDHNIGYGSAARCVVNIVRGAARDIHSSEENIAILEFPGDNSGWLAASAALAHTEAFPAPHAIILPERPHAVEEVIDEVKRAYHKYGYALVVTANGAKSATGDSLDGAALSSILQTEVGVPTRFERFASPLRSSQVSAARADSEEAHHVGVLLVRLAVDDCSGYFAALQRDGLGTAKGGYRYVDGTVRLDQIGEVLRTLPDEFIAENGFAPSDEFVSWLRPLVGGLTSDYVSLELSEE